MTRASTADDALTAKGRATRDRIVASAAELMHRRGVERTALDDVKTAASVSSSQLYHYFADKDALVRAVIAHQTDAILGGHAPYLAQLDSIQALRAWRDVLVDVRRESGCRSGCPIGSLGSQLAESSARARVQAAEGLRRWEAAIAEGLRRMQARGALRRDADPEALAIALLAAIQGGILLTQIYRETTPMEIALDAVIELIASKRPAARRRTSARRAR